MRRRLAAIAACALFSAVPAGATAGSWALPQIRIVVANGLMSTSVDDFRPDDPLTRGDLAGLVAGLTETAEQPVEDATTPVTIAQLDAALVHALGLADSGYRFYLGARKAGLTPPARFGSEVAARLLALRFNHPAKNDDLELLPSDPATRAEAAYSVARILGFGDWEAQDVKDASVEFQLPQLTPWQRRILNTAVRFVGYPYVWGGTSEKLESPFGVEARGGFDCSGFVWRVYRLQAYPDGGALAATIRGRSTFQMSGEVPRAKRIPFADLEPADVLFFGARGPRSKPAQVNHAGIYLGNGWFIHSSGQGVYLSSLTGWYRDRFAWGRRPLAEAGLVGS